MSVNGGYPSPGTSRAEEQTEHICGNCRTPLGKSSIPCRNEPKEQSA